MRDKIAKQLDTWENKVLGLESQDDIDKKEKRIFYGQKAGCIELKDWNYIVFGMEDLNKSGDNSMDLSGYYFVDIIRENFIDDETIFGIIEAIEELPGVKLCRGSNPIDYITKGKTDIVCEMMRLRFTKPMKRVNIYG